MKSSFLERYCRGDYEQVWSELVACGSAVFQEPLAADAQAVASEMMRRIRANLECLIARLRELGYRFAAEHPTWRHSLLALRFPRALAEIEQYGILPPVSIHVLQQLYGRRPPPQIETDDGVQGVAAAVRAAYPDITPHRREHGGMWRQPDDLLRARLAAVDQAYGPLPLTLRRWYETIGEVDVIGDHPTFAWWAEGAPAARDPLDLSFDDDVYAGYTAAPLDEFVMAHRNGDIWIGTNLPQPCFDARLSLWGQEPSTYLIPYLRMCFAWGGFPELQHQATPAVHEQLALLTRDLLPF